MIIASNFNNSWDVVVWILLISCWPNTLQQILKILISNLKLLKKSLILKQFKTKMLQCRLLQVFAVLENIQVPLFKLVHLLRLSQFRLVLKFFNEVSPHSCVQVYNLTKSLFFLLDSVSIRLLSLSVQLLQKIIQITFKPSSCVINSIWSNVEPPVCFHVHTFLLIVHLHVHLVKFIWLNNLNCSGASFFDW